MLVDFVLWIYVIISECFIEFEVDGFYKVFYFVD